MMDDRPPFVCAHDHCDLPENQRTNERRTWAVIALTLVTMAAEVSAGIVFGSMALLADGWHMASHASALGITALAYAFARRHRSNPRFTFGTGKVGDLAGYSSALLLAMVALAMIYASVQRLIAPVTIHFNEAILVAVLGLMVNLVSAFLLREQPHPPHDGHTHSHHQAKGRDTAHDHDHNLRAAYLHVLADALTSILAIAALTVGKFWGWAFLDPVMGIVGALVISRWSWGLMRQTGAVLLDHDQNRRLSHQIVAAVESVEGVRIEDLHVWRLGQGQYGAIVAVRTDPVRTPEFFKARLTHLDGLAHVTIEVNPALSPSSVT
jgi:cation diffusion facilitator family transporter